MAGEIVAYKPYAVQLHRWDMAVTIVRTDDGRAFFAVRPLCQGLGINSQTQLAMLQDDERYADALHTFRIPTAGGMQDVVCLRRRETAWWIANVNPKKVKASVRDDLEEFQAALMAEADRLLFGALPHVPESERGHVDYRQHDRIRIACLDCGAPHVVVIENGQAYVMRETGESGREP
jgi:hypothetical protein